MSVDVINPWAESKTPICELGGAFGAGGSPVKCGIVGATGYAGLEIARLLFSHPHVELVAVSSVSYTGQMLSGVYPSVASLLDNVLTEEREVVEKSEVVFASLPHGLSQGIAAACDRQGKIFIDLGADFRLHNEEDYKTWYDCQFDDHALHKKAVYAIPELFREQIRGTKLIANPGCYPTSIALGLAPLLKEKLISLPMGTKENGSQQAGGAFGCGGSPLIIDAKSGVTGAGRGLTQNTHFPDCNESFSPYKIANHRHTPEIEQTLSILAGQDVRVTFVPHLLPVNRGILSTIYVDTVKTLNEESLRGMYNEFYKDEKFVRILPAGVAADIKYVKYSNYCDISLHCDPRTGRVVVVSAIDNMMKGAAGQAVQNMNIVCGFPEDSGLNLIPPAF